MAEEAIDLDPVNPLGFAVAGWALIGEQQFARARPFLEEASEAAAEPDERSRYARQAARVAYATADASGALRLLCRPVTVLAHCQTPARFLEAVGRRAYSRIRHEVARGLAKLTRGSS